MSLQTYRALVVDDEEVVRTLTRLALTKEGIECDEAEDGVEAIGKATSGKYDTIITDLRMPKRHGHALAMELLTCDPRPLIVILTGVMEPRLAKDLLLRGVDDIQFKPVEYRLFAAKIRALLDRRHASSEQVAAAKPQPSGAAADEGLAPVTLAELDERLSRVIRILPVSNAAVEVINMAGLSTWTAREVAAVIEREPSLAVEVLRLANSSLHNPAGKKITELYQAVARIGQKSIGEVALGTTMLAALTREAIPWMDVELVWRRSMAAAVAVEALAASQTQPPPPGLFLSALMHSLGRIVLARLYVRHYEAMVEQCHRECLPLARLERKIFPMNQGEVILELLRRWNVPAEPYHPLRHSTESYASIQSLPAYERMPALLLKVGVLLGEIAIGRWESWDQIDLPPHGVLSELSVRNLPALVEHVRGSAEAVINFRSSKTNSEPGGQQAPQRQLSYCSIAGEEFDFLRPIIRSMGIELDDCDPISLVGEEHGLVNGLALSTPREMSNLSHLARSTSGLLVTETDGAEKLGGTENIVTLPCSYARLRQLCQAKCRDVEFSTHTAN